MPTLQFSTSANTIRSISESEDISFSITETPNTASPTVTHNLLDKDISYADITGSGDNSFTVNVSMPLNGLHSGYTLENLTPSTINLVGDKAHYVSNGTGTILIKSRYSAFKYTRTMALSSAPQKLFEKFNPGTLGEHVTSLVNSLTTGKDFTDSVTFLWSANNYNLDAPSVTPNSALFASSLDLSGISVMCNHRNSDGTISTTYMHPGLLISNRHIIGARHAPVYTKMVFRDSSGGLHLRTLTAKTSISVDNETPKVGNSSVLDAADIVIGYLDSPVPSGCKIFKVLPTNWANYIPVLDYRYDTEPDYRPLLPAITKMAHKINNASGDCLFTTCVYAANYTHGSSSTKLVFVQNPALNTYAISQDSFRFFKAAIGGDSGGPVFIPVNTGSEVENVLLTTYTTAASGASYAMYAAEINAAMNAQAAYFSDPLAGSYALQTVDLSGFTSY